MIQTAVILTIFAVLGGGLVAFSFQMTQKQIKANERAAFLSSLNALIPPEQYDNNLLTDIHEVQNGILLGINALMIYRARKEGQPVAAVLAPIIVNGYNGDIPLLVGIDYEGVLLGVRVIFHKETPGLGDGIDLRRSDWVLTFNGRSLTNPNEAGWFVQRDGGVFDQLTGATITPRAIVKAVHQTLLFFQQYRDEIFAENSK